MCSPGVVRTRAATCLYESDSVVGDPIGAKSVVIPASTWVMTSVQFTAARSAGGRATYASNRPMYVCASGDRSALVSVSPGIQPELGIVNFAVSEIAIDCFNIEMAAAITVSYRA